MKKIFLAHAIIFAGTIYGPGEVQAPDDTTELLAKRDAELTAAKEAATAPIAAAEDQQETDRNTETNLAPLDYIREVRKLLETRVVTPEFVIANLGADIVEAVKRSLPTTTTAKKTKPDAAQTETPAAPEKAEESAPAPTDTDATKDVTLSTKVVTALKTAGHDPFENPEALAALSDDELLAIDGIGPASIPTIRTYLSAVLA
jgi:predicted flap endonuclease-1-like 5' DNA nuclease